MLFLEINGIFCRKRQEPVGGNKPWQTPGKRKPTLNSRAPMPSAAAAAGKFIWGSCPECLGEYAKSYFLSRQRTAMLPQWRA